jgi:hypothetical protein
MGAPRALGTGAARASLRCAADRGPAACVRSCPAAEPPPQAHGALAAVRPTARLRPPPRPRGGAGPSRAAAAPCPRAGIPAWPTDTRNSIPAMPCRLPGNPKGRLPVTGQPHVPFAARQFPAPFVVVITARGHGWPGTLADDLSERPPEVPQPRPFVLGEHLRPVAARWAATEPLRLASEQATLVIRIVTVRPACVQAAPSAPVPWPARALRRCATGGMHDRGAPLGAGARGKPGARSWRRATALAHMRRMR